MAYEGMIAETITIIGDKDEPISAYVARPLGAGPFPGMVLLHHMPGWDEWYREAPAASPITATRRSATTFITAPARAKPTTSPPRCAPRAAFPTPR